MAYNARKNGRHPYEITPRFKPFTKTSDFDSSLGSGAGDYFFTFQSVGGPI